MARLIGIDEVALDILLWVLEHTGRNGFHWGVKEDGDLVGVMVLDGDHHFLKGRNTENGRLFEFIE